MFESFKQPLISRMAFLKRILICVLVSSLVLLFTISSGAAIIHYLGGFLWIDGILNASLIMMGVGVVGNIINKPILKIALSFYAIFSGIAFFAVLMILFSPLIHRFLHNFRLNTEN